MSLVSGGKQLLFHSISTYELQHTYGEYTEPIRSLDWSFDSKYLILVSRHGVVELLKPSAMNVTLLQRVRIKSACAATFFKKNHDYIAAGGSRGSVCVWDVKSHSIAKKFPAIDCSVTSIDVSCTDAHLAVGGENSDVSLFGISTNNKIQNYTIPHSKRKVTSVHFNQLSQSILGASNEAGYVAVWDMFKKKTPIFISEAHSTICSDIAFSPIHSQFLLSVGYDNYLNMYDMRKTDPVVSNKTEFPLTAISMSQDGTMVACSHRCGGIVIYDLRNSKDPFINLASHNGVVSIVKYQTSEANLVSSLDAYSIETNLHTGCDENRTPNSINRPNNFVDDSFFKIIADHPRSPNLPETYVPKRKRDSFLVALGIGDSGSSSSLNSFQVTSPQVTHCDLTETEEEYYCTPKHAEPQIPLIEDDTTNVVEQNESTQPAAVSQCPEFNQHVMETIAQAISETAKHSSFDIMQYMRTNMMSLYLSICKQHFSVMDRLTELETRSNPDLQTEIKKLRAENESLKFENEYLRLERAKYLPDILKDKDK